MSDGPYRVEYDNADSHPGELAFITGPGVDRYLSEYGMQSIVDDLNTAHRAASEKAAKVVDAARELIAAFDAANEVKYDENKWDRLVGGGSHERMREALADYDKGVSDEAS